jgi:hypothetical protein
MHSPTAYNSDKDEKADSDNSPAHLRRKDTSYRRPASVITHLPFVEATPAHTIASASLASAVQLAASSSALQPAAPESTSSMPVVSVNTTSAIAAHAHPGRLTGTDDVTNPQGRQPPSPHSRRAQPAQPTGQQSVRPTTGSAPPQGQHQQQARHRQPRGAAIFATDDFAARCGASVISDTALALVLTIDAATPASLSGALGKLLPSRLSAQDNRSKIAIATLLRTLKLVFPMLPREYGKCDTVAELTAIINARINVDPSNAGLDHCTLLTEAAAAGQPDILDALLVDHAQTVFSLVGAGEGRDNMLLEWEDVLTVHTGSLSTVTVGSAAAQQQDRRTARCVLKLDFISPLVLACLRHCFQQAAKDPTMMASRPLSSAPEHRASVARPPILMAVEPYHRRLIKARVAGFAFGPLDPGVDARCTHPEQLHGNWPLLLSFLKQAAPNCAPSNTPTQLPNGHGAVYFALEEPHRHELHRLVDVVAPQWGITRPLAITIDVWRQSHEMACSSCGEANHRARDCRQHPPGTGVITCKHCYTAEHLSHQCQLPHQQRKCGLCNTHGHSTHYCARYQPRWVELDTTQRPHERRTFRDARALLAQRGVPWSAVAAVAPEAQKQARALPLSDFPPFPAHALLASQPAAAAAVTSSAPRPAWLPRQQTEPVETALSHHMTELTKQLQTQHQQTQAMLQVQQQQMAAMLQQSLTVRDMMHDWMMMLKPVLHAFISRSLLDAEPSAQKRLMPLSPDDLTEEPVPLRATPHADTPNTFTTTQSTLTAASSQTTSLDASATAAPALVVRPNRQQDAEEIKEVDGARHQSVVNGNTGPHFPALTTTSTLIAPGIISDSPFTFHISAQPVTGSPPASHSQPTPPAYSGPPPPSGAPAVLHG